MTKKKLWVVYDERAAGGDTDDAIVLESCSSLSEAMNRALAGIVFEYDVVGKNELVNQTLLGPNKPLLKERLDASR